MYVFLFSSKLWNIHTYTLAVIIIFLFNLIPLTLKFSYIKIKSFELYKKNRKFSFLIFAIIRRNKKIWMHQSGVSYFQCMYKHLTRTPYAIVYAFREKASNYNRIYALKTALFCILVFFLLQKIAIVFLI